MGPGLHLRTSLQPAPIRAPPAKGHDGEQRHVADLLHPQQLTSNLCWHSACTVLCGGAMKDSPMETVSPQRTTDKERHDGWLSTFAYSSTNPLTDRRGSA